MKAENSYFEVQVSGFRLGVKIEGQILKVMMNCRETGKRYEGDLAYQTQSQAFKFNFAQMQQAYSYMEKSLTAKDGIVRVSSQGKLQIGIKALQRVRYLPLEIKQVQLQQAGRLIQLTSFIKRDVEALKVNINQVEINLDEQQANMLIIKSQLRQQIADLKQLLIGAINLKSDAQITDQKISGSQQQMIKKIIESKTELNQSIQNAKIQFANILQRELRNSDDRVNEIDAKVQEFKRQVQLFNHKDHTELVRLDRQIIQLGRNSEVQLAKQSQMRDIQAELQNRIKVEEENISNFRTIFNKQRKIFYGHANAWKNYNEKKYDGIVMEVDISQLGLQKTPKVFGSISGGNGAWQTTGMSSFYGLTNKSFTVYMRMTEQKLDVQWAKENKFLLHYQVVSNDDE